MTEQSNGQVPRRAELARSRAIDALLRLQKSDGHWCGELQGDSILESEYILMKFILGQEREPMADGRDGPQTLRRMANYLRSIQQPNGAWGQYPGAGPDLSATVKAYFTLKLLGDDPASPHLDRARRVVLEMGGAERCPSFTNFFLACLGQISFNALPEIPPEIIFLPRWFYFSLANVSAWTRTMIMPLSIVSTLRPVRELPPEACIDELFIDHDLRHRLTTERPASSVWKAFFMTTDRVLKTARGLKVNPLRRAALKRGERWILDRAGQDGDACTDGLGAIFPPMVYIQIALAALGYHRDHPAVRRAECELDALFLEQGDSIRVQPCFSPVWDTGIAAYALADCGMTAARDAALDRAAAWLRGKECRHVGDWANQVRAGVRFRRRRQVQEQVSGWWFEYNNAWYPDVDDTAMVAMALFRAGGDANRDAAGRGVAWLLSLQNDDGGWAAFDRTRHRPILEYVPFADHNAMQDPSCPDITGRVLECLSWQGGSMHDRPVRRAIEFIRAAQDPAGCWFGRWGVNYIYGTWQAVIGPIRCGLSRETPWVQAAGAWIKSIQKEDGSFGESADSYIDPTLKGRGPSTASQTAWAAMILQELFGHHDPELRRAIDWLIDTQLTDHHAADPSRNPDGDLPGSWVEPWFTGTGFPQVFYLRYHLYRLYFPVMALGRFVAAHGMGHDAGERPGRAPSRTCQLTEQV